jgi:hypothetical protein
VAESVRQWGPTQETTTHNNATINEVRVRAIGMRHRRRERHRGGDFSRDSDTSILLCHAVVRDHFDTNTGQDKDHTAQWDHVPRAQEQRDESQAGRPVMARRGTVSFKNQKNGLKNDRRTHESTRNPVMCPVLRMASLVERILRIDPRAGLDTTVNTICTQNRTDVKAKELKRHLQLA